MEPTSLYEILGVPREAAPGAIRDAYRAYARRTHPDHAQSDSDSAHKFQLGSDAYRILSDPVSREQYDTFLAASDPVSAFAVKTAGRLLYRRFGKAFHVLALGGVVAKAAIGSKRRVRGRNVRYRLPVTRDDLAAAGEVRLRYTKPVVCPACSGEGGSCGTCEGAGRVERWWSVAFDLPQGVRTGHRLRVTGEGEQGIAGAPAGDLIVEIVSATEGVSQ